MLTVGEGKMQKTIRGQKILQLCEELHMSEATDLQSQHTTAKQNERQNKNNTNSLNMSEKIQFILQWQYKNTTFIHRKSTALAKPNIMHPHKK